MGIAVGDYMNNGLLDFAISDFSDESKLLFRNRGRMADFNEVSMRSGIGKISIPFLGLGRWVPRLRQRRLARSDVRQWAHLSRCRPVSTGARRTRSGRCCFTTITTASSTEIPPVKGSGLAQVISGRGAAFGDLFNDGKIDVIINQIDGPPVLLRNVNPDHHHWVELKLVGGPKSPRDAIGATVYLTANGMRQRQDVISGGAMSPRTTRARTSGLAMRPMPARRRSTGLPAQKRRSSCRRSIASTPSPKGRESRRALRWTDRVLR